MQGGGEWLYLARVLDICSRHALGWSTATHMRAGMVIGAMTMAMATGGGHVAGVIFHGDRGSPYPCAVFAQGNDQFGTRRSMGRAGPICDSAPQGASGRG